MSERYFTHASPTLFNAGTPHPQLSSCFLVCMKDDSIEGIYDTLKTCAQISKTAGGIGLSIHNIRATGSYIAGTNGYSNGIVPMLRVYNNTARYVDQGGNKRPGAFAIYAEPCKLSLVLAGLPAYFSLRLTGHADIFEFIDLRKNHGKEEVRARDLFYALWIPDLFMKRVEQNADWSLFCPAEAPGLAEVHSQEFEDLFERYEKEGRAKKTVKAQKLWYAILEAQIETGGPFMLYKDAANCELGPHIRLTLTDICYQPNPTRRIWAQSSLQTCAPRSLNTLLLMKSLSATWLLSLCPALSGTAHTTLRSCTPSPRL